MTAFRHWRLVYHNVEDGGVRAEAAEIEMRLTAGGGDETGSGTPSASSAFEAVANAFDNDTGTRWRATTFDTAWIAYDFGVSNEKAIVELSVRVNTAASGPEHLRVDASTDGSTWIPQGYFFDLSWGATETKVLTFGPLPPPLRITVLQPTTITVAAPYSHPAAAQESVQWQLEDETGDFSTPLQDTGEISTDLTSHVFASLTGQTVYQVRVRQKEEDNSTWSDWSLLYVRTPEFINGERNDFGDDTLGSAPGGWTDHTAGEHVVIDDDTFFPNKGIFQNRHFSGAKVLASANNPTWNPTSDEMHWSAGPEILNQRIVALVQLYDGFGEVVIGGRWDATGGQGYLLWLRRDTGDNEAFLRGPGGAIASDVAAGVATSTWQWVVLEVLGSAVQAKWWPLGTAEPGSFQLSGVDAGFTDPGFAWMNGDQIGTGRPILDHIQVEHLDAQVPNTPVLSLDDFDDATAELSTDAFGGGSGVHMDSQWQVAIDSGFVSIIRDVLSDVDLEAHIATGLPSAQPLWARVRWRDDVGQPGAYSNVVTWTSLTNPGCGDTPTVIVGGVTNVEATLSTDPVAAYIETHFQIRQGTTVILEIFKTGGDSRFFHEFAGLTASTSYTGYVRVRRTCGFSPWSAGKDFTTLAVAPPAGSLLGCPPAPQDYLWNSDANPSGFEHWRGTGWYVPYPGEPLRGVVQCKLRMPLTLPGPSWDVDISDDLGVTYVPLVTNLDVSVTEGDGLEQFSFMLDTTILTDGIDYRLRATDGPTVVESLSFAVDNAGLMASFANRDFSPEAERFGIMWCTKKTGGVWGDPAAEFPNGEKAWWQNSISRDIIALRGHPWSVYADRDVPESLGGDATVRFYLWSGEGGFRGIQGAVDLEGWSAGIGFFVEGISETATEPPLADAQTGIFVGLESIAKAQGYGCCDDYYTMPGVSFSALGRANQGVTFAGLRREDDGAKNSANMETFPKLYGNSWYNRPNFEPAAPFVNNFVAFRQGHLPGVSPESKETCGRRYSVYTVRARVEVDPGDHGRVRIRARCDGPGVPEPSSGYWHYDKWHVVRTSEGETDYSAGCMGLASKQFASTLWGAANGGRNFVSWSALAITPSGVCGAPPEALEPFHPPQEGRPCSLILEAYDDDRESVKWEVGTDRDHLHPYLAEPEHYGEQEIDIIAGAATIAQVDAVVVDVSQTPGDQDSGWVTERLMEGGVGIVHGRRFRLRRFVSFELGWVTIADGPAGTPRLDPTYSAYRWEIRDTRETERRIRVFVDGKGTTNLLPMGVEAGFGQSIDPVTGDEFWVVEPNEPILGQMAFQLSAPGVPRFGYIDFGTHWSGNYNAFSGLQPEQQKVKPFLAITEDTYRAGLSDTMATDGGPPVFYTWPNIEILWRPQGSLEDYIVIKPSDTLTEDQRVAVPIEPPAQADPGSGVFYGRNIFRAFTGQLTGDPGKHMDRAVRWLQIQGVDEEGDLKTDFVYPTDGQLVEILVRWVGPPTEFAPLHIEFKDLRSYLWLPQEPGDFARTDYDPVLDITGAEGPISLQAEIAPNDWQVSGVIFSKWVSFNNYFLALQKGGFIQLAYVDDANMQHFIQSTAGVGYGVNTVAWVRGDLDVLLALVTFYTSGDGIAWTKLGDSVPVPGVVAPTSIDINVSSLDIGQPASATTGGAVAMRGRVYRVRILDGPALVYDAPFDTFLTPVLSFLELGPAALTVTIQQSTGGESVAEMRITGSPYSTGELLKDLYDGLYSPLDSVTGELVPSGIRYDEGRLLLMTDPIRLRITESVKDLRDWTEKQLYAPTGWVPALDNDLRISPVSQVPPTDLTASTTVPLPENTVLQITDAITEPAPNWNAGEEIVNVLTFKYPRVIRVDPEDAKSADLIDLKEIEIEFRDEASVTRHGEQQASYETEAFLAAGDPEGNSSVALELEQAFLHAEERKLYVFDRYVNGAQAVFVPVRRDFTSFLRPGDWVVIDLSWIPDYLTKRREGVFGGQILSIRDVDCAWRVLLIEEALPVIVS